MSKTPRLLIVEDDPAVDGLVRAAAGELGFACAGARGEPDFRELYERGGGDALYLDLQLACGDAVEVLRYLAGRRERMPILLASGCEARVVAAVAREGQALGLEVAATLLKPFDMTALHATLRKLLPSGTRPDANSVARIVARGEFELEFEPRVNLREMTLIDMRAHIANLNDAAGEPQLLGSDLIEAAEGLELGRPLTEHLLRKSLAFAGHWQRQGLDVGVAVELGAADLSDPALPDRVFDALNDHGVPSQCLRLVLRSADVLHHEGAVSQTLTRLRIQQIRTDLSDFGGAGGSIGALWRLPLDGVLLDGGLVESARLRREAREVLLATIALCHSLGMTTCARDLTCRETLDWARRQGCDQAQGQPLAGRLAAAAVPAWVRNWNDQPARSAI